jgi:hypothetical protein
VEDNPSRGFRNTVDEAGELAADVPTWGHCITDASV